MGGDEARLLLGFAPNSRPTPSEVKAAYRKKVWESHPDLFPAHEKPRAESKFKLLHHGGDKMQYITQSYQKGRHVYKAEQAHLLDMSTSGKCRNEFRGLGGRGEASSSVEYSRVVRTGVPRARGGKKNHALLKVPFILIIFGTVALGGINAARAYKKQKEEYPSHNPFLP